MHSNLQDTPAQGKLTEADLDAAIAAKYPLHPLIVAALVAALQPLMLRPAVPTVYRASNGRQRVFLSFSDAAAYDRGFRNYPQQIHAERGTPEAMGWMDASDEASGTAGMDDMAEWANSHSAECGRRLS